MATRHPNLLDPTSTAILVVDVQEQFRPHIHAFDAMVAGIRLLLEGARELSIPVAVSEQYPKGLGHTVPEITDVLTDEAHVFEKVEISSVAAPAWGQLPDEVRRAGQLVVVGIEAHVCVSQTTHDLLGQRRQVHVVADAVSSRDPWHRERALDRLARGGARITSVEMALFELMGIAGTPQFKAVQGLIKEHDARAAADPSLHRHQLVAPLAPSRTLEATS
jgi:nicotinamidase-related amidase